MILSAVGNDASIEIFENHLVITRRRPGLLTDRPSAEQFVPFSTIKSVEFIRAGFMAQGRIMLTLDGDSSNRVKGRSDKNSISFNKEQQTDFEKVLNAIQTAIATPSIERLAMAAQRRRVEDVSSSTGVNSEVESPVDISMNSNAKSANYQSVGEHYEHYYESITGKTSQSTQSDAAAASEVGPETLQFGKVIMIGLPILVLLGMCTSGGQSSLSNGSKDSVEQENSGSGTLSSDSLVGNWVLATKGGDDGKTTCTDFNAPELAKVNGNSAKIVSFGSDGKFQSLLVDGVDGSKRRELTESGDWSLAGDKLRYENVSGRPASGQDSADAREDDVKSDGANVLLLGPADKALRLVRCTGEVASVFPPANSAPPPRYEAVPYVPVVSDYTKACAEQDTINAAAKAFKTALGNGAWNQAIAQGASLDQALSNAFFLGDRISKLRVKFLGIRATEAKDAGTDFFMLRCTANVRFLEPVNEAGGIWSQYIQFNGAQYSIKFRKGGSAENDAYFVAELRPVDGRWDVEEGTE